jgi:hypothetical protein
MATAEECNDEWERGYLDGWMSVTSTRPTMPVRPALVPPGVDPLPYFYKAGEKKGIKNGIEAAIRTMKRL